MQKQKMVWRNIFYAEVLFFIFAEPPSRRAGIYVHSEPFLLYHQCLEVEMAFYIVTSPYGVLYLRCKSKSRVSTTTLTTLLDSTGCCWSVHAHDGCHSNISSGPLDFPNNFYIFCPPGLE